MVSLSVIASGFLKKNISDVIWGNKPAVKHFRELNKVQFNHCTKRPEFVHRAPSLNNNGKCRLTVRYP